MVLDASLLNTQHYKVRIKGKVEQSREGVAPPLHLGVVAIEKGAFGLPSTKGRQLYFLLMILSRNMMEWGLFFNIVSIAIHPLLPSVLKRLDPVVKKSSIWRHHWEHFSIWPFSDLLCNPINGNKTFSFTLLQPFHVIVGFKWTILLWSSYGPLSRVTRRLPFW